MEHLKYFHKINDDLENTELKIEDEDKTILLLNSLPRSFEHFKYAIFYGKESTITLDKVHTTIRFKEFSKVKDLKIDDNDKGLSVSRRGI